MKKPLALITGVAGFAGSYLAEELLANGYRVVGSLLAGESTENIDHLENKIKLVQMDIVDQQLCRKVIGQIKPDYIFHLAAFSSVGRSFGQERLTYKVNLDGTLNVLEASISLKRLKKLVFVSSADTYGQVGATGKALAENQPLNPVSPYGIAKAAAEQTCFLFSGRQDLPVTVARSFNHIGPRQSLDFAIPSFAKQIVNIEKHRAKPVIFVGDLSVRRDLTDVRDIVRGYRLLAEKGKTGRAYNLCSGRAVTIESVLNQMLKLSEREIEVKIDRSRMRKNDIPVLRGNNSRATKEVGFKAVYNLKETIRDTLNYWRSKPNS